MDKTPTPEQKAEKTLKQVKNPFAGISWYTPGLGWQINYKGTYFHEGLYKTMFHFLQDNGYRSIPEGNALGAVGADDVFETQYEERHLSGRREIWYRWRAKKVVQDELEQYIFFNAHLLGVQDQEVMIEGNKVKTHSLEIDCWLRGGLRWLTPWKKGTKRYEDIFGPDGRRLYKRFYYWERAAMEDDAYDELVDLHDRMKTILGLPVHRGDDRPLIVERRGYPKYTTDAPDTQPNPDK